MCDQVIHGHQLSNLDPATTQQLKVSGTDTSHIFGEKGFLWGDESQKDIEELLYFNYLQFIS